MEFNTLIKTELFPILQKHNFEILEELENIVRFTSSNMKVNVVFNDRDRSCFVEFGKKNEVLYPLNNHAVEIIFGIPLALEQVSPDVFVKNLSSLFEKREGVELLKGNIKSLEDIITQQSSDYTSKLLQEQELARASKAWERNDYVTFIDSIDKIGLDKLPQSYQLKYKIAKEKQ